ncbi:MAG: hypothetical protein GYA35_03085 [Thermoanaerobaculaceae bacterium]|nr:hypothetical protein [Thermoanaerobaculaceae bacterium]
MRENLIFFKNNNMLEVNYNFDAIFGYPCQPEEMPSKNPKVLVIEKKQ